MLRQCLLLFLLQLRPVHLDLLLLVRAQPPGLCQRLRHLFGLPLQVFVHPLHVPLVVDHNLDPVDPLLNALFVAPHLLFGCSLPLFVLFQARYLVLEHRLQEFYRTEGVSRRFEKKGFLGGGVVFRGFVVIEEGSTGDDCAALWGLDLLRMTRFGVYRGRVALLTLEGLSCRMFEFLKVSLALS